MFSDFVEKVQQRSEKYPNYKDLVMLRKSKHHPVDE